MASVPPAQPILKPTFAKVRRHSSLTAPPCELARLTPKQVAASHYVPTCTNQNTQNPNTIPTELNPVRILQNATPEVERAVKPAGPNGTAEQPPAVLAKDHQLEKSSASSRVSQASAMSAGEPRPAESLTKASAADDSSTQVSSSDSSAKLPSFDKQSVASGTTFALDEKESLRPDDSASIRAIEEEDVFSAPGTGATGSRVGSDTDARAFSEQLHQIAVMAPRGVLQPVSVMRANITFGEMPMSMATPQPQVLPTNGGVIAMPVTVTAPTPDEKLLEALEAPRDRVYVLKIEQDILDFLNNDK
jgi:hypothetical protein